MRYLEKTVLALIEGFKILAVVEREWIDYEIREVSGGYELEIYQVQEGVMRIVYQIGKRGQLLGVK